MAKRGARPGHTPAHRPGDRVFVVVDACVTGDYEAHDGRGLLDRILAVTYGGPPERAAAIAVNRPGVLVVAAHQAALLLHALPPTAPGPPTVPAPGR